MLENKRERFKTFLRKIDESAISRIKHLMKESYAADAGTIPAKVKKGRMKSKLGSRKGFSLEENQLEVQQQTKSLSRQVLHRSLTLDIDRPLERSESLNSRSSFMKHNKTFHKLFPEVPETEDLLHAYVCALQKEVPYHGRLYVTDSSLCFFSSVLLKDTKLVVPVASVSVLKKQNTALLVPNAVSIRTTDGEKYLFVSLRNREGCYKLLRSVCPQLEDGSANSSPLFSSAESSFDQAKPLNSSHSSLDERDEVSPQIQLSASPLASENTAIKSPSATRGSPQTADESSGDEDTGSSWVWSVTDRVQSLLIQREVSNLNTLLLIYLILVFLLLLSSGYIGLRIVALEEQLTSLGALPEFTLQSGYKET
ncbi:GRAM domain-containing protein 3-like isoform X4 [Sinocyclocheilus anshuiensis]|uniref:GRAM domain-containing protein 3-like isoform X4 n=1 Tax=Sinocyclocheilus anshuiensis TaxID=1608454 RepID=UPI0007B798F8|nr:PREDICTED: GRAM domain-containing protein 3-like isoform X4 [Sinocyclocheilus anshuiensis]